VRLFTAEGRFLTDPTESVAAVWIQENDHLMAIAQEVKLAATQQAFALWCCGGSKIITWGDPACRGESSQVQHQLRNVQQVQATNHAFAAILADGSVVTWGEPEIGGDSRAI
jgi:hypothetical protein